MAGIEMREATRECKNCGVSFVHRYRTGAPKRHCSKECSTAYHIRQRLPRSEWPTCSSVGCSRTVRAFNSTKCNPCYTSERKQLAGICRIQKCDRPATRVGHGVCEVHYYRIRRNGTADLLPIRIELQHSGGYLIRKTGDHPLAVKNGWAFDHRIVAYEKYGPGMQECHWCGAPLAWADTVVDHLNEQKQDNRPANLVTACSPCNRARGAMIPFIARMKPERVAELVATFEHMRATGAQPA